MAKNVPVQDEFAAVKNVLDRVFADTFGANPFRSGWTTVTSNTNRAQLRVDVYANDSDVVILAAVPGVRLEDLDITVDKNTVTLTGKTWDASESAESKDATWYLHELFTGDFSRRLTIPFDIDGANAQASLENGILRLVLPKAESAKPRKIAVKATAPVAIEAETSVEA